MTVLAKQLLLLRPITIGKQQEEGSQIEIDNKIFINNLFITNNSGGDAVVQVFNV